MCRLRETESLGVPARDSPAAQKRVWKSLGLGGHLAAAETSHEARRPGCKAAPAQEPQPGDRPDQSACRHHQCSQPRQVPASSRAGSREALERTRTTPARRGQPGRRERRGSLPRGRGSDFSQAEGQDLLNGAGPATPSARLGGRGAGLPRRTRGH